jgi:predicted Fe-Mo cluster-binding NifX family protein
MNIIVTAEGQDLNGATSPRFGRCPTYILIDTETMAFEALPNPAASASGGAGIQAAQFVVEQGAQALLTGNVGPNAAQVLAAASVSVYLNQEATVEAAVKAFKAGRLPLTEGATVAAHAGMGGARGRGRAAAPGPTRDQEIAELRARAAELRAELADVIDCIENLEKES